MKTKFYTRAIPMIVLMLLSYLLPAQVAGIKGYNWADKDDNFQTSRIEPSGLTGSLSNNNIDQLTDRVCNAFKGAGKGNTIRFGINPQTINDNNYWTKYKRLINRCMNNHNMKIILAYWEGQKDGRIDNYNDWKSMWQTVDNEYGNNSKVYMEPMNEPHGYGTNELLNIYQDFRNFMNKLPDGRTLLGGTGYSEDVAAIGGDSRVGNCKFSLHIYHWFGGNTNENGWKTRLNQKVGNYASKTIVTEWGSECTQGADYSNSSSDNKISYVRGISDRVDELNLGSVYWPGVRDSGDWFRIFNSSSNLSVTNQSMMDRIHISFGEGSSGGGSGGGAVANGVYYIKNRNSNKCLRTYQQSNNNGTKIVQHNCGNNDARKWTITHLGNEVYSIVQKSSGKYMDISNGSTSNGANAIIWPNNGGDNQKWKLIKDGNYYHIENVKSGKLLDISGGSSSNNADCIQWSSNNGQNQDWTLDYRSASRTVDEDEVETVATSAEEQILEISLYPNPTTKPDVTILTPEVYNNGHFTLINQSGRSVSTGTIQSSRTKLNVANLSKGLYYLRLENGSASEVRKLVLK